LNLLAFGNRCGRVNAPAGTIRFFSHAVVRDSGERDAYAPEAGEAGLAENPTDTLPFILPSRYYEVDSGLLDFAWKRFAAIRGASGIWPNSKRPERSRIANRVKESNLRDIWIAPREKSDRCQSALLFPGNSLASHPRVSGTRSNLIATDISYGSR
jgi:hypothetical protein